MPCLPAFSPCGLARLTTIGFKLWAQARLTKPEAGSVFVITNPTDEHVNNSYAREIVERWQALGAKEVCHFEFDPQLKLQHDLMDPEQPYQQVDEVYSILLNWITG